MKRGGTILVSTAVLAIAACGTGGKLEVRSIPRPLAPGKQPGSVRVAEGQAKLALGNPALALEAFRNAQRENPNSVEALAGMAQAYDMMGRTDLSRRYFESALAIAPGDVHVLGAFAASLQSQGLSEEAGRVRQEIAARSGARASPSAAIAQSLPSRSPTPVGVPEVASAQTAPSRSDIAIPYAMPSAGPVQQEAPAAAPAVELRRPEFAAAVSVAAQAPAPSRVPVTAPRVDAVKLEMAAEEPRRAEPAITPPPTRTADLGPSVSIKLPAARRVETPAPSVTVVSASAPVSSHIEPRTTLALAAAPAPEFEPVASSVVAEAPAPLPAPSQLQPLVRAEQKIAVAEEQGPRLERLSMGEIGLITSAGPVWRSTMVAQSARTTTIRFVPLREASTLPPRVRLLNAARVNRLAATTRAWLVAHGWRGLGIGNASSTRQASVILYPAEKLWLARRLRAQFGFATQRASVSQVTVLLGSDAARHPALRSKRA